MERTNAPHGVIPNLKNPDRRKARPFTISCQLLCFISNSIQVGFFDGLRLTDCGVGKLIRLIGLRQEKRNRMRDELFQDFFQEESRLGFANVPRADCEQKA